MEKSYYQNRKGMYAITKYQAIELIIVDDPKPGNPDDEHASKNNRIREAFSECTNAEISSLELPPNWTMQDWHEAWNQKLADKGDGDLIIIFFHGQAGWNGFDWCWALSSNRRQPVNAYRLIEKINDTEVDCLLIADCWLPTRLRNRWNRDTRRHGNTEIFSRGEEMPNLRGRPVDGAGEFTKALARNMHKFLEAVMREENKDEEEQKIKAPRSLLEIMWGDKSINSNPRRVWLNRCQKPHRELIRRVKFVPWAIRDSGKLEFHAMQVQPMEERYRGYGKIVKIINGQEVEFEVEFDEAAEGAEELEDEGFEEDVMSMKSSEEDDDNNGLFLPMD